MFALDFSFTPQVSHKAPVRVHNFLQQFSPCPQSVFDWSKKCGVSTQAEAEYRAMPLDKRPSGTPACLYVPPNCPHAGLPDNSCAPSPSLQKKMWPVRLYDTLPKPKTSLLLPKPPKQCHSGTKRPRNTALVKEAPFTSSPRVSPPPPLQARRPAKEIPLDGLRRGGVWAPCGFRADGWQRQRGSGAIRPGGSWTQCGPVAYRPPARGPGQARARCSWEREKRHGTKLLFASQAIVSHGVTQQQPPNYVRTMSLIIRSGVSAMR